MNEANELRAAAERLRSYCHGEMPDTAGPSGQDCYRLAGQMLSDTCSVIDAYLALTSAPPAFDATAFVRKVLDWGVRIERTCESQQLPDDEQYRRLDAAVAELSADLAAELAPNLAREQADDGSGLTDEEYGRAWAKQQGKSPQKGSDDFSWYWRCHKPAEHAIVPHALYLFSPPDLMWKFHCEGAAYAALGQCVREVHRQVPALGVKLEEQR